MVRRCPSVISVVPVLSNPPQKPYSLPSSDSAQRGQGTLGRTLKLGNRLLKRPAVVSWGSCTHSNLGHTTSHHPRHHEHEGGPGAVPGVRLLRGDRDGQDAGHVLPHRQAEVQDRGLHLLRGRQAAGHQGTLNNDAIHLTIRMFIYVLDRPEFTRTWRE